MELLKKLNRLFGQDVKKPEEPPYYAPLRNGDYESGLPLLQQFIRRDDAHAMSCYASLLLTGKGVPADADECALWYRQSAVRGDPAGMAGLGMVCLHGHGVPRDLGEAVFWLFKATKSGHQKAANALLGVLAEHPDLVGKHFTDDEFEEAYASAFSDDDVFVVRRTGETVH